MAEPFLNPDEAMEKRLLSLAENEEETADLQPPVVNIFRLRMEAERRRSRRQVQAVTIAVWFSVTTTLGILCYFILSLLPELEKGFSPAARRLLAQLRESFASYGAFLNAIGIAMSLGFLFSAVLLIVKRNSFFAQKNELK